jgi:hypothetical protein
MIEERNLNHLHLQRKYSSNKEKYCGWTMVYGSVIPQMNPGYLTKNNLW